MEPFDHYPGGGNRPLRWFWIRLRGLGSGCRTPQGYGTSLMRLTGLTNCAYCDLSFIEDVRFWMSMQVDHVVPSGVGKALKVREEFYNDPINFVLACSRCNGFLNRYRPSKHLPREEWSLSDFLTLRDEVFLERKLLIAAACAKEDETFAQRPWEKRFEVIFPTNEESPAGDGGNDRAT